MKIRVFVCLGLLAAAQAVWAAAGYASACRPEIGEWAQFEQSPSPEELSGMRRLSFGGAEVFSGPRGMIHTAEAPERLAGEFEARGVWKDDALELRLLKRDEPAGSIRLSLPGVWTFFQTEGMEFRAEEEMPRMYKEIRLEGAFSASGAFALKESLAPGYRLIFQGAGGRCFEAEDFSRWILQVTGLDPEKPSSPGRVIYFSLRGGFERQAG